MKYWGWRDGSICNVLKDLNSESDPSKKPARYIVIIPVLGTQRRGSLGQAVQPPGYLQVRKIRYRVTGKPPNINLCLTHAYTGTHTHTNPK